MGGTSIAFDTGTDTDIGDRGDNDARLDGTGFDSGRLSGPDTRAPIEGVTIGGRHDEETHGDDGGFAWRSEDGHSFELRADGSFRLERFDGSVYEREPFGTLEEQSSSGRGSAKDLSGEPTVDADGNLTWDDGRGNQVQLMKNGDAVFAREDGTMRRHIHREDSDTPVVLDSYSSDNAVGVSVNFPLPATRAGAVRAINTTPLENGFEATFASRESEDVLSIRSTSGGGYQWTDNAGKFIAVDGLSGTLTVQNGNGDWRTLEPDGSGSEGNVHGREPSTNWPDYDIVVTHDDGIRHVTNPDGSVVSTNREGDFDLQGTNGTSYYRDSASGESASIVEDGFWVLRDESGEKSIVGTLALDGAPPIGQGALEGGGVTIDENVMSDGTVVLTFDDGSEYIMSPDGSTEFNSERGSVRRDSGGDIVWKGRTAPAARASGTSSTARC